MKAFINEVAPLIQQFEVKYVGGATPEIFFYSEDNELVEKVDVSNFKKSEIVQLVAEYGFLVSIAEKDHGDL